MSNLAVGLVWVRSRAKGSNLLVLLAIADGATDQGKGFWGSNEHLAEKSRLTARSLRYILAKLKRDGEIVMRRNLERIKPEGSNGYIPDRFFDVRCLCAWKAYQTDRRGKVFRAGGKVCRAKFSTAATKDFQTNDQKLPRSKRKDLLVDLSVEVQAAPAAPIPVQIPRTDPATYKQLEVVVHDVIDGPEPFDGLSDFTEAVKMRCAALHLLYEPSELARAIGSITMVRGFQRRALRKIL